MGFKAEENFRRLERCASMGGMIEAVEFNSAARNRHVAIFNDPIDEFVAGRILFYQKSIFRRIGEYPEITKAIPSCLKVFFSVQGMNERSEEILVDFFNSASFSSVCKDIDLAYVQFCGKLYYPS